MPTFIIEREIEAAGRLSPSALQVISQKSVEVLDRLGPDITWLHSYVTGAKIYCVYIAPDEARILEHARQGGFPANSVSRVASIIDPTTATALAGDSR